MTCLWTNLPSLFTHGSIFVWIRSNVNICVAIYSYKWFAHTLSNSSSCNQVLISHNSGNLQSQVSKPNIFNNLYLNEDVNHLWASYFPFLCSKTPLSAELSILWSLSDKMLSGCSINICWVNKWMNKHMNRSTFKLIASCIFPVRLWLFS